MQLLSAGVMVVGGSVGGPALSGMNVHGEKSLLKLISSIAMSPSRVDPTTASKTS